MSEFRIEIGANLAPQESYLGYHKPTMSPQNFEGQGQQGTHVSIKSSCNRVQLKGLAALGEALENIL